LRISSFKGACQRVAETLRSEVLSGSSEQAIQRLGDPLLLREVEAVAPCAERFVDYEVNPPVHGKAVGQATPIAILSPLAKLIGETRIDRLDGDRIGELRGALATSLAWGYMGLASVGEVSWRGEAIKPRVDLDLAELWQLWVSYLSGGIDGLRTPGAAADRTLQAARVRAMDQLTASLKGLDLMPRRLKRLRVKLVGQKYVENGMLLRLLQGAADKREAPGFARKMVERNWPFAGSA
jgi:hypothetical protein